METCTLCSVLRDEKFRVIYEDGLVAAILVQEPIKTGHVMLQTVRCVDNLSDLTNEEAGAFLKLTEKMMLAVEELSGTGSLTTVNGWNFRSQKHFHSHVVPSSKSTRSLFHGAEGTPVRQLVNRESLVTNTEKLKEILAAQK